MTGGSSVAMPQGRKSGKGGLIIAIVAVLLVAGGVVAVILTSGDKNEDGQVAGNDPNASGSGSGSELGSGSGSTGGVIPMGAVDAASGVGSGSGSTIVIDAAAMANGNGSGGRDPGSGSGSSTDPGSGRDPGSGSASNPGSGSAASDPGSGSARVELEPIEVTVTSKPPGGMVFVAGKKQGRAPQIVKVVPGKRKKITIRLPGYEDASRTIDGQSEMLELTLNKKKDEGVGKPCDPLLDPTCLP
jgi:hypothetical protein